MAKKKTTADEVVQGLNTLRESASSALNEAVWLAQLMTQDDGVMHIPEVQAEVMDVAALALAAARDIAHFAVLVISAAERRGVK